MGGVVVGWRLGEDAVGNQSTGHSTGHNKCAAVGKRKPEGLPDTTGVPLLFWSKGPEWTVNVNFPCRCAFRHSRKTCNSLTFKKLPPPPPPHTHTRRAPARRQGPPEVKPPHFLQRLQPRLRLLRLLLGGPQRLLLLRNGLLHLPAPSENEQQQGISRQHGGSGGGSSRGKPRQRSSRGKPRQRSSSGSHRRQQQGKPKQHRASASASSSSSSSRGSRARGGVIGSG